MPIGNWDTKITKSSSYGKFVFVRTTNNDILIISCFDPIKGIAVAVDHFT